MRKLILLYAFIAAIAFAQSTIQTLTFTDRTGATVARNQDVAFCGVAARLNPTTNRVLGPDGNETAWQQTSDGCLHVSLYNGHFPRSLFPGPLKISGIGGSADYLQISFDTAFSSQTGLAEPNGVTGNLVIGDAIEVAGPNIPSALSGCVSAACYVTNLTGTDGQMDAYISATPGGSAIGSISGSIVNMTITRLGFVQVAGRTDGQLYRRAHDYKLGDVVVPATDGALPTGLTCTTCYVVGTLTADTYYLSATKGGSALTMTANTGSGKHSLWTTWSWRIQSGAATTVFSPCPISVAVVSGNYQLGNCNTGVEIPTSAGWTSPKAPIQRIKFHDGSWYGNTSNAMYERTGGAMNSSTTHTGLSSYTARIVESGPLLTDIVSSYVTARVEYQGGASNIVAVNAATDTITLSSAGGLNSTCSNYNQQIADHGSGAFRAVGAGPSPIADGSLYTLVGTATPCEFMLLSSGVGVNITGTMPTGALAQIINFAGTGYITEHHTLYANSESVLVNDAADTPFQWYFNAKPAVNPDTIRASVFAYGSCWTTSAPGYANEFDVLKSVSSSETKDVTTAGAGDCNSSHLPRLLLWYQNNADVPIYGTLFNEAAGGTANILGIATGRASQLEYAINAGPGWYTNPSHFADSNAASVGITMYLDFSSPNSTLAAYSKREWVLHAGGTRADVPADADWNLRSTTLLERNGLAGAGTMTKRVAIDQDSAPGGGFGHQFFSSTALSALKALIADGTGECGSTGCYATQLSSSITDVQSADLIQMFKLNTAHGTTLSLATAKAFWQYVNQNNFSGDNAQANKFSYWYAASVGNQNMTALIEVLLDSNTSVADKAWIVSYMKGFCGLLLDNDFTPLDNVNGTGATGDSVGLPNMPVQYAMARAVCSTYLNYDPSFAKFYAKTALPNFYSLIGSCAKTFGAIPDSVGYFPAVCGAAMFEGLQLKQAGLISPADFPQLRAMGYFLMNYHSPPDARFGGGRKHPGTGDAFTVPTVLLGMVATFFKGADDTASQMFYSAWKSQTVGSSMAYDGFYGSPLLAIDTSLSTTSPALKSFIVPDYMASLRIGYGTANEGTIFLDLTPQSDHQHASIGAMMAYFGKVPISVTPSSFYNPAHAGGAIATSNVVQNSNLGSANWYDDNPDINAPIFKYGTATINQFFAGTKVSMVDVTFTPTSGPAWTRRIVLASPDITYPLAGMFDTFSNSAATTLSQHFMSTTSIGTPAGTRTPTTRNGGSADENADAFPSGAPPNTLDTYGSSGLQCHQLTGQIWNSSYAPGGGQDWAWCALGMNSVSNFWGNWSHNVTGSNEAGQFLAANGTAYSESQNIYRASSSGDYQHFLASYPKGSAPTRTLSSSVAGTLHNVDTTTGTHTSNLSRAQVDYVNGTETLLWSGDSSTHTANNLSVTGIGLLDCTTSTACTFIYGGQSAAGLTCADLSSFGGTWYTSTPAYIPTANKFCFWSPGTAANANTHYTVTLSTTSGTRRLLSLSRKDAAATSVDYSVDGVPVARATCDGTSHLCPVVITVTVADHTVTAQSRDGSGNAIGSIDTSVRHVN